MEISFSDTDALIEAEAGKKISEIFVDDGEAHFRELEVAIVTKALVDEPGVLALGGGSVMSEPSRQAISQSGATVVYLEVGIAQAAPRIGFNTERPMLLVNPRQKWLSLMQERAPIYTELADLTFSTDSKKPHQVAEEILAALKVDR
jgi:shikimate kinase